MELTAVALAIYEERFNLANRTVTVYIDNNAVSGAIVKSQTSIAIAQNMIGALWLLAANFNISLWFDRVPSLANIADLPTRDKALPFQAGNSGPFKLMEEWIGWDENFFSN